MRVEVRGVSKSFAERTLFTGLSYSFPEGDVTTIRGESGSGKTTLLNIMALYESPNNGAVIYDDVNVTELPAREQQNMIRENVGYIYQDIRLFENLSVEDNLRLALRFSSVPRNEWTSSIDEFVERVGLGGFQRKETHLLSGGEKQRVAIARALVCRKRLIFADEPTGALDPHTTTLIIDLIKELVESTQSTLIMVTHSAQVAQSFSNTVWLEPGTNAILRPDTGLL